MVKSAIVTVAIWYAAIRPYLSPKIANYLIISLKLDSPKNKHMIALMGQPFWMSSDI